jgi:hypothetical protein
VSERPRWTAYDLAMVDAIREVRKGDGSPPVMVRVYCEKHSRLVARVVDLRGHGAFLVLNRPTKLSPKVVELHRALPEQFAQTGDRILSDPHYELLEHPDVREEAVLNLEYSTGDIYMGAWCGKGHRLSLDLEPLLEVVSAYRRGDRVKKLTV